MSTLTGNTAQSTYQSLLKTADNGVVGNTIKNITDGLGNPTALSIGATSITVSGSLTLSGSLLVANNAALQVTASNATSASYALTASYAMNGGGTTINTGSLATTGSNTFVGTQTISGSIKFGDNTQQITITGADTSLAYPNAQRMILQGTQGTGSFGEGGDIYLWAGAGSTDSGSGGDIKVRGGIGYNNQGGYVKIQGGNATYLGGQGGYVLIEGGYGYNSGSGGDVTVRTQPGYNGGISGKLYLNTPSNEIIIDDNATSFISNKVVSVTGSLNITGSLTQNGYEIKPYRVYTALLSQNGTTNIQFIYLAPLTVGVTYQIANNDAELDDFTNVGATSNATGTMFVATGTTPAVWSNGSFLAWDTGAPVVVSLLENTLGCDIIWYYLNPGLYYGQVQNNQIATFGIDKYYAPMPQGGYDTAANNGGGGDPYSWFRQSDTELRIATTGDGVLENCQIGIKVYN